MKAPDALPPAGRDVTLAMTPPVSIGYFCRECGAVGSAPSHRVTCSQYRPAGAS